jgi:alpha-maltose-1-phosphate synthase
MKVLYLTNEYPPSVYGGAGVHIDYLSREVAKLIPVEVRCFGSQSTRTPGLTVKGYGAHAPWIERTDAKLRSPLSAFETCLSFAADPPNANVVHCHTWYTHYGGVLIKQGYDLPLVITTHSLEPLRPWKQEQIGLGYRMSSWIEKTALEMADALIAVSEGMRRDLISHFRIEESRIHLIYNGIDVDEYRRTDSTDRLLRYGIDPTVPYVLFVGRITRQKGIHHLLKAAEYLDPSAQLVLAAGQPDTKEIGDEVEAAVRSLRETRGNVVWIREWVETATKIQLYSHASVFCCPSIYEPFGIINLEAMACGTPVVGSAVGGITEILIDGVTGHLVPLEQSDRSPFEALEPRKFAQDLASRISDILRSPSTGRAMGEAGRKRVEEIFSWATVARQTVDLYRSLT